MRLRIALLALAAATPACSENDDGASFADEVTAPGQSSGVTVGSDAGPVSSSSSGAPEDPTEAATVTGEPWTTGEPPEMTTLPVPDPSTSTGPDEPGTSTTGEPVDNCPRVRVTVVQGEVLNIRPAPSTAGEPLGVLQSGAVVDVLSIVAGEVIEGNGTWYEIDGPVVDGFVWGGFAECTLDEIPEDDGFYLPLQCGAKVVVSQGNNGNFSHVGQSLYAFDFSLGSGTPLVAIADGTVAHAYGGTKPGDPCYDGGGQECNAAANYVTLLHADGTRSIYAHLSEPSVSVGDFVPRGTVVGKSGSTGWSTGRHAHVARTENCGSPWCQSIPVAFVDVAGDGVPGTGDTVTSMNCP